MVGFVRRENARQNSSLFFAVSLVVAVRKETITIFWKEKTMFKKVSLAVVALLVTASLANAVPVLTLGGPTSVAVGDTITLTVSSNNTQAYKVYIGFDPSPIATITGVTQTSNAGDCCAITPSPFGYANYFLIEAKDTSDPFDSVLPGVQWNVSFKGLSLGAVTVDLYDNTFVNIVDSKQVTVTPEPATLLLLGLGGVLLRKRSR